MLDVRVGIAAASMALLVAGCSALPSAGPTAAEIVTQAVATESPARLNFELIDLSDEVVTVLATRQQGSLLRSFGAGGPAPQLVVGTGDSVAVTIWEAGAGGLFSSPAVSTLAPGSRTATIPEQVVAADGTIGVPYAGRIRVLGLRPADIEGEIVRRLQGKAIEPQAVVTITRNVANTVSITGEVVGGAVVPLSVKGVRVLEGIAAAGGLRAPAHESFIRLTRANRTASVPFNTILARPAENIYLRGGDVLTVIREPQTFSAFGATGQNAVVPFDAAGMTLEEAVAKAGGLLDRRADPRGVFLFRYEPADLIYNFRTAARPTVVENGFVPVVYRLDLREARSYFIARRFHMQNKDILFVANAPFSDVEKFIGMLATVAQPAVTAAALYRVAR
jgi:polysaccharide export outer membrane protein